MCLSGLCLLFSVSFLNFYNSDEEVDYQLIDFYEETKVKFADLSEDLLWEYINSGEPMWVCTFELWSAVLYSMWAYSLLSVV